MNLGKYISSIRQQGKRCFTIEQLMSDLNVSKNAALNAIYRRKEYRDLISPAKGLYVIVPPEYIPYGCIPAEELVPILMKYIGVEYYVGLLSAAMFYGATHQKPAIFQIVTNKRIKHPLEFGLIKLSVIYKKDLSNLPLRDFTVPTGYLKVSSPELVIFDLFNYPRKSGGLNHIATVLSELIPAVDGRKLIDLAEYVKENAWLQRLGFILEQIDIMDEDKQLEIMSVVSKYLSKKLLHFIPLAPELGRVGYPKIQKWKIIANTDVESDL